MELTQEGVDNIVARMFLNMDPPHNIEYRKLIRDNFTPGTVATYEDKLNGYQPSLPFNARRFREDRRVRR